MKVSFAVLAFFCVSAIAVNIPYEWRVSDMQPHPTDEIKVIISLKQENLDEIERLFWERSDPRHPNYAKYLSRAELATLLSPGGLREKEVSQWLINNGFYAEQINGIETKDVLYVTGQVKQFENLFNVKFEVFQNVNVPEKHIYRSRNIARIPNEIQDAIYMLHGINDFPPMQRRNRNRKLDTETIDQFELFDKHSSSSSPSITIKGVNARGQTPGTSISVTVEYSCPSNDNCISEIQVNAESNNENIIFSSSASVNTPCDNQICSIVVPVDFYVPLNITVEAVGSSSIPAQNWGYPVVVDPHVVPQTLWDLYNMEGNPLVNNPNATQAVVEFEQQYYSQTDLEAFFVLMGIPNAPVTVVGPNDETNPGAEANLDIQWIMAMAPGAPTTFWSIAASNSLEIDHILTWAYEVGNYTNPPLVNSLSYGMTEGNVDKYLGAGYLTRTNTQLQVLALQGLTIIIADGDVGANDIGPPPMSQLYCFPSHPDWPSDSAYVTAIGSTFITPLAEKICYVPNGSNCLGNPLGEVTVSVDMGMSWTTGGGFSNVTPRPSYQDLAVNQYLKNSDTVPPTDYFNQTGRAYADAVTVGHNLEVVLNSQLVAIDGTSASAPIFAGMVTVLNNIRMNAGKSPLGFITPLMYQSFSDVPSCWNDVTVGHNKCGSYSWKPVCCQTGFSATVGWDPVAGVGSPNMQMLKKYVLSLP